MYILKPSFEADCFALLSSQCKKKVVVKFCPPRQNYSQKNHLGYWAEKKEYQGKYTCDTCLVEIYRNHKQFHLNLVVDNIKRRTFRAYFGGKNANALLTGTQQKELEQSELHNILRKRGVDLDKGGLGDYLESWRQTVLKLVQENSLLQKEIRELEKLLAKKKKKKKEIDKVIEEFLAKLFLI